jgi:hypothetical protein
MRAGDPVWRELWRCERNIRSFLLHVHFKHVQDFKSFIVSSTKFLNYDSTREASLDKFDVAVASRQSNTAGL